MRKLRAALAGTVASVMVGVSPLAVASQIDDESADARADTPGETTFVGDLVYATGRAPAEATELTLFLIHPSAESEDTPMVVDVGGSADARALAERGVSVFTLIPPDRWPEIKYDADPTALRTWAEAVACAVRFARGSEYGSETAPLVLVGFSKYAGLASHVALAGDDFGRVWEEYEESEGGPPAQYDCTVSEASTRVDGLVGVGGVYDAFVGIEGRYADIRLEHEPDLWEMLRGTFGLHPELRVRLLHGDEDFVVPLVVSVALETVLAEAGYDVELVEFAGGHYAPYGLLVETVMELLQ